MYINYILWLAQRTRCGGVKQDHLHKISFLNLHGCVCVLFLTSKRVYPLLQLTYGVHI